MLVNAEIIRFVEAHDKCLESVAVLQLYGELLRGIRIRNSPDSHAVEMTGRRLIILNKNRLVVREEALAQPLGIPAIRKSPNLNCELSNGGIGAGEQFDAHGSRAGANHVQRHGRGAREVKYAVPHEWPAIDHADLDIAAIVEIRDAQDAAKRERAMRRDERIHVENFAVGSAAPVEWDSVPGRGSLFDEHAGDERRAAGWRLRGARRGGLTCGRRRGRDLFCSSGGLWRSAGDRVPVSAACQ